MELKVLKIVQARSWFQLGEHSMSLPGTSRIRRHHAAPTQRGRFCPSSRSSSSSSQSTHCRRHLCFHSRSLIDSCVRSAFFYCYCLLVVRMRSLHLAKGCMQEVCIILAVSLLLFLQRIFKQYISRTLIALLICGLCIYFGLACGGKYIDYDTDKPYLFRREILNT